MSVGLQHTCKHCIRCMCVELACTVHEHRTPTHVQALRTLHKPRPSVHIRDRRAPTHVQTLCTLHKRHASMHMHERRAPTACKHCVYLHKRRASVHIHGHAIQPQHTCKHCARCTSVELASAYISGKLQHTYKHCVTCTGVEVARTSMSVEL
jgi:hypothetical protein